MCVVAVVQTGARLFYRKNDDSECQIPPKNSELLSAENNTMPVVYFDQLSGRDSGNNFFVP